MIRLDELRQHRQILSGVSGWVILPLLILPLLLVSTVAAQQAQEPRTAPFQQVLVKDKPINISSDKMEVSQKQGTIVFEGHVVAQQENLTMTGKKLVVYAVKEKSKTAKGSGEQSGMIERLDRIELSGEVRISQGEKLATCEKAVYYRQEQKIILSGNPQVSQGKDVLNGRLITLYLLEERSVIEGGGQNPVKATLFPDGKKVD
jgi:lipopolysaccharide export system protein LptA